MNRARFPRSAAVITVLVATSLAMHSPAVAQNAAPDTVLYGMAPNSEFEWGCFPPCACPVFIREPVQGTFRLNRSHSDPLFDYYDVTDVRWRTSDATTPLAIEGSGVYRRGGEAAIQEQLVLDLSINGGPRERFDSGLVPPGAPFPEIQTTILRDAGVCMDSAFVVVAKPLGVLSADLDRSGDLLSVRPTPFRGSTKVEFTLRGAGRIDLTVLDVTGRRVASLAHGEWLTAGAWRKTWDGRVTTGAVAPPGLYFVRLVTPTAVRTRETVKIE